MSKFAFTAGVAASGIYTAAGVFTDTQTVVVGGKTYTSRATLGALDGSFHIDSTAALTLLNLYDAINAGRGYTDQGQGVGVGYTAATVRNKQVYGSAVDATTLTVKANVLGTIGNLIASTETQTNGSWGGATLASGTGDSGVMLDDIIAELDHLRDETQQNSDALGHIEIVRAALVALAPES
jgi:hypothetical protein